MLVKVAGELAQQVEQGSLQIVALGRAVGFKALRCALVHVRGVQAILRGLVLAAPLLMSGDVAGFLLDVEEGHAVEGELRRLLVQGPRRCRVAVVAELVGAVFKVKAVVRSGF